MRTGFVWAVKIDVSFQDPNGFLVVKFLKFCFAVQKGALQENLCVCVCV